MSCNKCPLLPMFTAEIEAVTNQAFVEAACLDEAYKTLNNFRAKQIAENASTDNATIELTAAKVADEAKLLAEEDAAIRVMWLTAREKAIKKALSDPRHMILAREAEKCRGPIKSGSFLWWGQVTLKCGSTDRRLRAQFMKDK